MSIKNNMFYLIILCFYVSKTRSQGFEHAKLFGNTESLGYYYLDVWVGSPPVRQTVIISTGSSMTAFPCSDCTDCGTHLDKYFNITNSTTSRKIGCHEDIPCAMCMDNSCWYSVAYADGSSISGYLVEDYLMFGDDFAYAHSVLAIFGCHRRETHLFSTQLADGVMGIKNSKEVPNIVDLLYKNNVIGSDVFGICFGKNDGFMTIGGYNISMHDEPIRWAEIHSEKLKYYSIKVNALQVNYTDVGLTSNDLAFGYETGTFVEAGTTYTYLNRFVHSTLFREIEIFCMSKGKCQGDHVTVQGEPHTCYNHDETVFPNISDFYQTFPVISFEIDQVVIDWRPEYYLSAPPGLPRSFCVGVYSNGGDGNCLGGNFMRGMDVIFDRTEKRIGFAHSSCDPLYIEYSSGIPEDQPGNSTNQPGNSTNQPGNSTNQPGSTTNQTGNSTDQPGNSTNQPGNSTNQPGNSTNQPGNSTNQTTNSTDSKGKTHQDTNQTANATNESENSTDSGKAHQDTNQTANSTASEGGATQHDNHAENATGSGHGSDLLSNKSKGFWIVMIGVSILLSVLLIISIVLCCKRRMAGAYKLQVDLEIRP